MLKLEKEEIVKLGNSKEAVGKYTEAIKHKDTYTSSNNKSDLLKEKRKFSTICCSVAFTVFSHVGSKLDEFLAVCLVC